MGGCSVFAQWFGTDIAAIACAFIADANPVFAWEHVVRPNRRRLGVGAVERSRVAKERGHCDRTPRSSASRFQPGWTWIRGQPHASRWSRQVRAGGRSEERRVGK